MNKNELKKVLISIRTQENESQINNLLGKIDLMEDEKLKTIVDQIGNSQEDIKNYVQNIIEQKKENKNAEHTPINDMFTYGVTENCIHLHMPINLRGMIKEIGVSRTIDTVNMYLLDAVERIRTMKNDGFYRFQEKDSIYMISPILDKKERNFLDNLEFDTKVYSAKELQDEEFVNKNPEAQLANHIFGNKQNVGTASISLDIVNSDQWQEKRKAQEEEFKEKGITINTEAKEINK